MDREKQAADSADTAIERSLMNQSIDASQANLAMEREFYERDDETNSADAVDVAEVFRNQS
ncbi:hypothetical protein [Paenibacillus thermotolerans]|uniref:hypothetical protein n=1 Tax=Paenibacillus thermotolerans TaxID=3027807 RepID=UPI002368293A|nr:MULTISPECIES: hypothetical protein [unclassified Paenibacillus]